MQILRIPSSDLRREEWFGFHTKFRGTVIKFGADRLGIGELFNLSTPIYNKGDELLEVLNKSTYTKELESDDKKRDDLIRGLFGVTKSSLKQPDVAKQNAAEHLDILFQKYKKPLLEGNYLEESSAIYNLLQDLDGAYAAHVALLGLGGWVEAIREADANFRDKYAQRTQENVDKPKNELRKVRAQLDTLYQGMIGTCEIRLLIDGLGGDVVVDPKELDTSSHGDDYDENPYLYGNVNYNFVIEWNEIVKTYRNLLAQRAGRRAKKNAAGVLEPELPQEEA